MDAPDSTSLAPAPTEEQQEIRRTLRDLLAERAGPQENRAASETPEGYDTGLWARLSGTLGLAGLALPEEYGGVGRGPAALALACEETGRALAPTPLLATAVLAAPLIAALGTPRQRAELLPRIADGSLTCALAVPGGALALALGLTGDNTAGAWSGGGRAGGVQARPADGGWRLYGEAPQVIDGHSAGLLLVAAHAGGFARSRTLLFLVRASGEGDGDGEGAVGTEGLVRTRLTTLDPTRAQATVELRDAGAELLGEEPADVLGALAATGRTAAVMLAAEAVGAAGAALDRAVERAGSPPGPAAAHRLAELYAQVQAARSLTYGAAREPEPEPGAGPGAVPGAGPGSPAGPDGGPLALAHALEALRATAAESVHLHGGGPGSGREHEAHRYVRRAASDELLFGPAPRLRARAAERTGLLGEVAA
ncbi:acyl-CoA dehydrogenase family protein [Streptomyces sp. NPDC020807]|uniref:acyl-CoA dehydrogenase family protein n=1 Tax=Streptomyces sp. NPDC020807 TaxID=3155119 RepID=UPI0033F0F469